MKKIIVGMSGGVDSSVAAYLLQREGWDVTGVFMKNWEDTQEDSSYRKDVLSGCPWEEDAADARRVCDLLGIPFRIWDFTQEYRDAVFSSFLQELEEGITPNPDILCNQEIKFKLFFEKALEQEGVEAVATGHYAKRIGKALCRPKDRQKDQTYFLYRMNPEVLPAVYFPLADFTKQEVRCIAQEQQFPTANKKDSTGICFIGNIDYQLFVRQYLPPRPGDIWTVDGQRVGSHEGLHFFTIGQRKGVNIGGNGPYYVVQKDMKNNRLIVTTEKNDPKLFSRRCVVRNVHWLSDLTLPARCEVLIRYRQEPQPALLRSCEQGSDEIEIFFDTPQRAVTPGQSAVWYTEDCVRGGGIIYDTADEAY